MDEDLDDYFASEGAVAAVPTSSTVNNLKESKETEEKQINGFCWSVHQYYLQLECQLLKSRLKSFDLLRNEEESVRYHTVHCKADVDEGRSFVQELTAEYLADIQRASAQSSKNKITYSLLSTVFSNQVAPPAPEATRKFVEAYYNDYLHVKTITQNIFFPWQTFDKDVLKACSKLLAADKIDECRAYFMGYMEAISRLPVDLQTTQGKQCMQVAGAALGRHPFGSAFTKYLVATKILLVRIGVGSLTSAILKSKLTDFFMLMNMAWDLR
jgi:hypothetical protein